MSELTAVVTGGSKGLGWAMSQGLLGAGFRVISIGRDPEAHERLRGESGAGPRLETLVVDLTDAAACDQLATRLAERPGGVDVLVLNAGLVHATVAEPDFLTSPAPFWATSADEWRYMFALNTHSAFALARACAPGMVAKGWGRIIANTTSLSTMTAKGMGPYGASKAALEALIASMAKDLEGTGVTANVVIPGGMADTAMIADRPGLDRSKLIPPSAMNPPLLWLVSAAANDVTSRRFIASLWDPELPPAEAAAAAGAPAAWPAGASTPIYPAGVTPPP